MLIEISSLSDPRIADYVGVREAELRQDRYDAPGGLFIAEGDLVFRRLIRSRYATRSVLVTHRRLPAVQDAVALLPAETPVYLVDQPTMNGIVGFNIHRGLLALGVRGPEPTLDTLLAQASCVVVLEDLVNHDNIGAIFRNVAALAGVGLGGGAVLLSPRCSDPLYRKAVRVSIGWALSVPFARLSSWPDQLATVRQAGFRVFALHPDPSGRDIAEVATSMCGKPAKVALIVGTEGAGLSQGAVESADVCVQIPMRGRTLSEAAGSGGLAHDPTALEGVDSLNVGVAVAIALHRLATALGTG